MFLRNIGLGEILLLLLLALVVFGPERIGKVGKELGRSIRGFQEGLRGEEESHTNGN